MHVNAIIWFVNAEGDEVSPIPGVEGGEVEVVKKNPTLNLSEWGIDMNLSIVLRLAD